MEQKKTVVVGASTKTDRYAYLAALSLMDNGHDVVLLGIRKGSVQGVEIQDISGQPKIENVDTITLYIGPQRQGPWYPYLLGLKPKRIIFNPGTENAEFEALAEAQGIETLQACTLVMLNTGQY